MDLSKQSISKLQSHQGTDDEALDSKCFPMLRPSQTSLDLSVWPCFEVIEITTVGPLAPTSKQLVYGIWPLLYFDGYVMSCYNVPT